jgi:hypothetical protein
VKTPVIPVGGIERALSRASLEAKIYPDNIARKFAIEHLRDGTAEVEGPERISTRRLQSPPPSATRSKPMELTYDVGTRRLREWRPFLGP